MSNALESQDAKTIQRARAKHLRDLFEPWTYRKLETRTGIGRSTLQSRMSGDTAVTLSDIEVLAPVIRMKPEELAAELLAVKLPEVDSNHQPAGFTPRLIVGGSQTTTDRGRLTAVSTHDRPKSQNGHGQKSHKAG